MDVTVGAPIHQMTTGAYPQEWETFSPNGSEIALVYSYKSVGFGRETGPVNVIPNRRGEPVRIDRDGPYQLTDDVPEGEVDRLEGWGP